MALLTPPSPTPIGAATTTPDNTPQGVIDTPTAITA